MLKRVVVLVSTLASVVLLVPPSVAVDPNQVTIPFTKGKLSIVQIAASVTNTTNSSVVGIPFTISIGDPTKLPPKLRIGTIGGLNGVSGAPGNQVFTYEIFVAVDATSIAALPATSKSNTFDLKIGEGNFRVVRNDVAGKKLCGFVGDASKSLIKIDMPNLPKLNFGDLGVLLKKGCAGVKTP